MAAQSTIRDLRHIRLLTGVVVGGYAGNSGDVLEVDKDVSASAARTAIANGWAEAYTKPKPRKQASAAPSDD